MTINEVTFDKPRVSSGFSVIFCFCRLKPFRFALKFSTEIFTPYRVVPDFEVGSRNSWSLPDNFAAPSATGNKKYSPLFGVIISFCIDSSRINF